LNKLYNYAAYNWGHHAREASILIPEVVSFLKRKAQVEASSQGLLAEKRYSSHREYSQRFPKDMTGLHLAAYFGVEAVVQLLLATKVDADSKDNWGRTPLSYAAENGHETVVKLLLDTGKVDADSKENENRTPLSYAAAKGHEAVVRLLLTINGVDPNFEDSSYGRMMQGWAGQTDYELEELRHLLVGMRSIDSGWSVVQTASMMMSRLQHFGWMPLSYLERYGNQEALWLMYGADPISNGGWTSLSYAVRYGHYAVVRLLLETGKVDLDFRYPKGRTSLDLALEGGHEEITKLLLEKGCGLTNEAVVQLLLATGQVKANSKDTHGQTPLSWVLRQYSC
jgi:ankyrin repeat protein